MKIGICGDVHWSQYSSIVRRRGKKYSYRLENLIDSINFVESTCVDCSMMVYLGDFFDKPELNCEEITALQEINWNDLPHYFLVGNHEMGINDLSISSAHLLKLKANIHLIDTPFTMPVADDNLNVENYDIRFIPYILEENRKSFTEYCNNPNSIVFSHNDLKGIQMGKFISTQGFDIDEIDRNCKRFFNGHLHNGSKISSKILNVGNISGQNFSEDAMKYEHMVYIYDTETNVCAAYINPYAFNFYKLENDLPPITTNNSVVTISCESDKYNEIKQKLLDSDSIIDFRIIKKSNNIIDINTPKESLSINHLEEFSNYIQNVLGTDSTVMEELSYIIK